MILFFVSIRTHRNNNLVDIFNPALVVKGKILAETERHARQARLLIPPNQLDRRFNIRYPDRAKSPNSAKLHTAKPLSA